MRTGFLAVWLPLDVCGFCPVLAREWHARLTHDLPAYVPISGPPLDYANCAENQGEHAPEADEGRKVKMPNYEYHEHPFNSACQAAKTCHHSDVLPVREPVEPSIHRNLGLQATRAVSARLLRDHKYILDAATCRTGSVKSRRIRSRSDAVGALGFRETSTISGGGSGSGLLPEPRRCRGLSLARLADAGARRAGPPPLPRRPATWSRSSGP
jgi:hypothetical protein